MFLFELSDIKKNVFIKKKKIKSYNLSKKEYCVKIK